MLVGVLVSLIGLTTQSLGSNIGGQIDNVRDNPKLGGSCIKFHLSSSLNVIK